MLVTPTGRVVPNKFLLDQGRFEIGSGNTCPLSGDQYNLPIFVMGPPRRGSEWECIAIREIRIQAKQIANLLLQEINQRDLSK